MFNKCILNRQTVLTDIVVPTEKNKENNRLKLSIHFEHAGNTMHMHHSISYV
jgi:hypothetical protein